jgi:hypothetical protein
VADFDQLITNCGTNAQCIEVQRINVSASFFLSIEFQQTGYMVERFYKAAFGNTNGNSNFGGAHTLQVPVIRFDEFLRDSQRVGRGVVVLASGWEQLLESNKQAYALAVHQRFPGHEDAGAVCRSAESERRQRPVSQRTDDGD